LMWVSGSLFALGAAKLLSIVLVGRDDLDHQLCVLTGCQRLSVMLRKTGNSRPY